MKYWVLVLFCIGCRIINPTVTEVISADTITLSNGAKIQYAGLEAPAPSSQWFEFCRESNAYLVLNKSVLITIEPELNSGDTVIAYIYTPVIIGKETKYLFVNAELDTVAPPNSSDKP